MISRALKKALDREAPFVSVNEITGEHQLIIPLNAKSKVQSTRLRKEIIKILVEAGG